MNKIFLWIAAAAAVVLQSCEKTDGIRDEIQSLRDRVAALENRVGEVNRDIVALHRLMDESTVIVGVKTTATGYEIELSDGTSLPVILGQTLDALVPVMGIDAEGYWTVSLDNGQTTTRLEVDGKNVSAWPLKDGTPAENAAGVTPQLRVDADGNWLVSADGVNYVPLLQGGEKVNAVGDKVEISYSGFFKSVDYNAEKGTLVVELLTGEWLSLAVQDDFGITVTAAENEHFCLGETRQFEVVQRNVAEALITAPAGWSARLDETTLTVTAPRTYDAAKAAATLSVAAVSPQNYRKVAVVNVTLLDKQLDADAAEAWRNFKTGTAQNVLLDFSYAGYKHGETAPPDVSTLGYKVYNVVDYGADPSGKSSSRAAFVRLLEELKLTGRNASGGNQANANARAVIYFPEGDFVLHDQSDNTPVGDGSYTSSDIVVLGGNFVIKGAGRDKTRLVMDAPNWPANPSNLWSSPVMLNIKHNSSRIDTSSQKYDPLATVTDDAAKGAFSVTVGSAAGLRAGQWVMLYLQSRDAELVAAELAPHERGSLMTDIQTVCVYDYHQIASVSGNRVTFREPLMHAVEARYGWQIREYPHYENVGIEDLTFTGHAKEQFKHHDTWQDDGAYKPVQMMRLTDSWMRRVAFTDVSEALSVVHSANCSAYDIEISGNRGHSAVRAQASSRVFIGKVNDRSDGYTLVNAGGNTLGTYQTGVGQYHASGVSETSMGTVLWNNSWGSDALFEAHSRQPRATLVDRCTGGFVQWRFGGDQASVPNHLADLTLWNLNATRAVHDFGTGVFQWWKPNGTDTYWKTLPPIIVGFHGAAVNFALQDEQGVEQVKYLESNGAPVEPLSLYEAQLRERLGYVPAWIEALK